MQQVLIVGYGKMGHAIEASCAQVGYQVVGHVDSLKELEQILASHDDPMVAVEFTQPTAAVDNLLACINAGVPVVCGTTGWYSQLPTVEKILQLHPRSAVVYAPNFSLGVYYTKKMVQILSKMNSLLHEASSVAIAEAHHVEKKDAPSGTAIMLAQEFIQPHGVYSSWQLTPTAAKEALPITAIREGQEPGRHTIALTTPDESITLTHQAAQRHAFVTGVMLAIPYIATHPGLHTMDDLMEWAERDLGANVK
jgi:dihydrodipicolinate reductase